MLLKQSINSDDSESNKKTQMKLRQLEAKDVSFMLEWMHDGATIQYLRNDFASKTEEDCFDFIIRAQDMTQHIHLAIVNDVDEYMGTVSLKHIHQNTAELGLVVRRCARGKGYALFGLKEIIKYGYRNRGINHIYWCVNPDNKRALRFYDENRYQRINAPLQAEGYTEEEKQNSIWYRAVFNPDPERSSIYGETRE